MVVGSPGLCAVMGPRPSRCRRGSASGVQVASMKKLLLFAPLALLAATPAHATGGLVCRTAGARPIEVGVDFGHVPGTPIVALRLTDSGRLGAGHLRTMVAGPE